MKNNILSIHYIRGISALMVVLFHFRGVLNNVYAQKDLGTILFRWGEIGVDAFFIISGFIICFSTQNSKSAIDFILKRFFRIYPAYFLFVSISLLLSFYFSSISLNDIINAIFILPIDYSKGGPFFGYSYLVVAWSLFFEINFYFLFVISMLISHKYRGVISSIFIASFVFIPQLLLNQGLSSSPLIYAELKIFSYINILTSPMMLTFIVGIVLYESMPLINYLANTLNEWIIRVAFYASLTVFTYCYFTGFNSWHGLTNSVLFICPVIVCCMLYEIRIGIPKIKALSFFGDISYSLYLSHLVVLSVLAKFGGDFYHLSSGFSRLLILLSSSLIAAYISLNVIEKPCTKLCRKLISRINQCNK